VAKLTLINRKVRYSAPNLFNDPFDTQTDLHFPFEFEELKEPTLQRLHDAVNSNKPLPNADKHPHAWIVEHFRKNRAKIPLSGSDLRIELMPAIEEGIGQLANSLPKMHQHLRDEFIQTAKIFCVSEVPDDLLMWSHYADNHKGAVIKYRCLPQLDNMLCAAVRVAYQEEMPVMATLEEWIDSAFGFCPLDHKKMWNKTFATKSIHWAYEKEWRVIVSFEQPLADYTDFKIDPREIGEVILGCRMLEHDKSEILDLLSGDFGHVVVLESQKNQRKFVLDFCPLARPSRNRS
jgi:hypothetical protein